MASDPVINPEIPYVGSVEGGLAPGKMVKIQGKVPPNAVRFAVNYQLGPTLNPRDDIALHVSPRFPEGIVTRNHIESMSWGEEENDGPLPIQPGQGFEILILCEPALYRIAINGRHFAEFLHRLPYQKVTHLVIDGDVEIHSIHYEQVHPPPSSSPRPMSVPDVPPANFGPPGPGGLYPTLDPNGPPPPGGYGPPPFAGYGPPPPGGYGPAPPGGYGPPPPRAYGYEQPEEEDVFGGCLDKVGMALGGLVAAGGVAAAMHALNKKKDEEKDHEKVEGSRTESESGGLGNLGALGAALASSLASNALQGGGNQGYPSQGQGGNVVGSILDAIGGGHHQPQAPSQPTDPLGGALGSILGGVLGGGGGGHQPPPSHQPSDPFGGALGSILGGVLGGGGSSNQPSYQPSGGYNAPQSGGYGQQSPGGSDLLSGIGSALFSSALDGLSKHGKDKPHGDNHPNYGPPPSSQSTPRTDDSRPSTGGTKLTAEEISKGLGLSDDES